MAFLKNNKPSIDEYDTLVRYFMHGFISSSTHDYSLIHYAGLPGMAGYTVNGLEGFARTSPLFAAWIYSGRPAKVVDPQTGKLVDLIDVLRRGILSGTDPLSQNYWGDIKSNDQRILETADISRLLWLTKEPIWFKLSDIERKKVADWLLQVNNAKITNRNNWILSPIIVNGFLKSVGYEKDADYSAYFEFEQNYLESGWFADGPRGRVDYYNAWSISYDLYWIHLFDPALDSEFIKDALLNSGRLTSLLISPEGIPMMGRSICYRTGIPSAIIAGAFVSQASLSPSLARRALDVTWHYFISHNVLRDGTLTMGYFETDPKIVENYSGPGSCHWGLRSLILAYMARPTDKFWQDAPASLPVEIGDYRLEFPKLGWVITGNQATKDITITISKNTNDNVYVEPFSDYRKLFEELMHRPMRPSNEDLKYTLHAYSAKTPLNGNL
ncbi:MAG TPA: DUF2264 domain-containing protein [Methylocella sp.]|nr:DUF2264 domain-containing protein [Methylocella sp.]